MAKWLQQVSRNAFGGVRILGREEVETSSGLQSVPLDITTTEAAVVEAADLLNDAILNALGFDGLDPNYAPQAPTEG